MIPFRDGQTPEKATVLEALCHVRVGKLYCRSSPFAQACINYAWFLYHGINVTSLILTSDAPPKSLEIHVLDSISHLSVTILSNDNFRAIKLLTIAALLNSSAPTNTLSRN